MSKRNEMLALATEFLGISKFTYYNHKKEDKNFEKNLMTIVEALKKGTVRERKTKLYQINYNEDFLDLIWEQHMELQDEYEEVLEWIKCKKQLFTEKPMVKIS